MPPDSPNPASPHRIRRNGDGERQWSVVLSCSVVTLLCLTSGVTIAIPSNVFLDLAQKDSPHRLTIFQQSVFAVSHSFPCFVCENPTSETVAKFIRRDRPSIFTRSFPKGC